MTSKLTITRERLQEIAEDGFLKHGESKELARMALAAMDSEPVAWTDEEELRDANAGACGYLFGIGSSANKFADPRRQIMLYRHAQQPVVPDDVLDALQKVARIRLDLNDFDGDRRGIADCLCDAEEALIEVVNRRAAMLQGAENAESRCGIQTAPALDSFKKNAESRCGNSPVIPDGYVMVPKEPTQAMCAAFNDSDYGRKSLRERYVAMLAAAQQPQDEPQNIPEIIPGWIPVSERMPEDRTQVILWDAEIGEVTSGHYSHKTHTFYHCGDAIQNEITHWMLPPCAPQEEK